MRTSLIIGKVAPQTQTALFDDYEFCCAYYMWILSQFLQKQTREPFLGESGEGLGEQTGEGRGQGWRAGRPCYPGVAVTQALLCLSAWPSLLGFHTQMSHCLRGQDM